jgi:hypothetical protein
VSLLAGSVWQGQVSTHPDGRGIRVAWLSPRPISDPAEITTFPAPLLPGQVDDHGNTIAEMGRGALAITVPADSGAGVRLITTHLKSKLLTFPGGRFNPATRTSGPGSPPTRWPAAPARPRPPSGWPSPPSWPDRATSAR